jgi:hypothetical protein
MSTATTAKDPKAAPPAPAPGTVPPEEKFWKRYSAHGEAPISLGGSFALHALVGGGMLLFSIYLASLLFNPARSLPVEPVRLNLGGGGGNPRGVGDAKGVGKGAENIEDKDREPAVPGLEEEPRRPALDPAEIKKVEENFDPATARYITERKSDSAKDFARLNKALRDKLRVKDDVTPGKGKGGDGSGGGKGSGTGPGVGSGVGPGSDRAKLTVREKRMLRWHMRFTASTGPEYLEQLRQLGAILAFPVQEEPVPIFKVVRDLRPGARLSDEDVSKFNRIYWWDKERRSVVDILNALGIRLEPLPKRFVAFMPQALENDLYRMERNYVERVLRVKFNEDMVDETNFRVVLTPQGFRPELISVQLMK